LGERQDRKHRSDHDQREERHFAGLHHKSTFQNIWDFRAAGCSKRRNATLRIGLRRFEEAAETG
jgi:hypothetical protein